MYDYKAVLECKKNGVWTDPATAHTCTADGIAVDDTKTEIGAVTVTKLETGRYLASLSSETEYAGVAFMFESQDPNYEDKTIFVHVVSLNSEIEAIDTVVDSILVDTAAIPAQFLALQGADSDTLETLSDQIDAVTTWTAANISDSISEGNIVQIRGNSWSIPIEDLTLYSNKIQFAIKDSLERTDAQSLIYIDTADGLTVVNKATYATGAHGSLSYAGTTLTVAVDPEVTAELAAAKYKYRIQSVDADGTVAEDYGGDFTITADGVRATE